MKVLLIIFVCIVSIYAASLVEKKQNRSDHRIVNGAEISIDKAPYHVSIQSKTGNHICGGSIFSYDGVITTAECALKIKYNSNTHQIRYNSDEHNWGGSIATIMSVFIHPDYQAGQLHSNIAVIRIYEWFPLEVYDRVLLRCFESEVNFERLTVAGWGYIRDQTGQLSTRLRQTELPYAGNTCERYYLSTTGQRVDETMFCAGDLDHGGTGICVGDLGGAAVKKIGSFNVITGVASHFNECGGPKLISLFSRVSTLHDWIQNSTGIYVECYY